MKKRLSRLVLTLALLAAAALAYHILLSLSETWPELLPSPPPTYALDALPEYSGEPSVILNDNLPNFPEEDKTAVAFESYSPLDELGRCGTAYANVGRETMPTGEREPIGMIRPTGWQFTKYDFIDGQYLYNRCHLIAHQLTAENANERNLVTGTRYMNTQGMLPYENQVADYVKKTGNHVLYRVTPLFEGENPVCSGVEMEAWSVEDEGGGVCFHVYAYNVQPGVVIDYATGDNWLAEPAAPEETAEGNGSEAVTYVLNTNSHRFHRPDCSGVASIARGNRRDYTGTRDELLAQGYTPCGSCNP